MKNIIVTGYHGQLGTAVNQLFAGDNDIKLINTDACDTIWILRDTYNTQYSVQDMKYLEEHIEGGETA